MVVARNLLGSDTTREDLQKDYRQMFYSIFVCAHYLPLGRGWQDSFIPLSPSQTLPLASARPPFSLRLSFPINTHHHPQRGILTGSAFLPGCLFAASFVTAHTTKQEWSCLLYFPPSPTLFINGSGSHPASHREQHSTLRNKCDI